jgi:hypothetical protein
MASGTRTKSSLKDRPKYKQERSLKNRRKKNKLAAKRRRSLTRAKARRRKRTGRKKIGA